MAYLIGKMCRLMYNMDCLILCILKLLGVYVQKWRAKVDRPVHFLPLMAVRLGGVVQRGPERSRDRAWGERQKVIN